MQSAFPGTGSHGGIRRRGGRELPWHAQARMDNRGPVSIDPAARRAKRAFTTLSASSIGLEFGLSVVIGLLGGRWLDQRLGTTPWLMMLLLVLGLVAGFRNVLRAVQRADRASRDEAAEKAINSPGSVPSQGLPGVPGANSTQSGVQSNIDKPREDAP